MDSLNPRPDEKLQDLPPPQEEGYRVLPASPKRPTPPDPRSLDRSSITWEYDDTEERQFSLLGMLALMTLIAALLAPVQWLPLTVYALFLGISSLLLLAMIWQSRQLILWLAFWSVLAAYLATCVMAWREVP